MNTEEEKYTELDLFIYDAIKELCKEKKVVRLYDLTSYFSLKNKIEDLSDYIHHICNNENIEKGIVEDCECKTIIFTNRSFRDSMMIAFNLYGAIDTSEILLKEKDRFSLYEKENLNGTDIYNFDAITKDIIRDNTNSTNISNLKIGWTLNNMNIPTSCLTFKDQDGNNNILKFKFGDKISVLTPDSIDNPMLNNIAIGITVFRKE